MFIHSPGKSTSISFSPPPIRFPLFGKALTALCLISWLIGCEPAQQPVQHHQIGIINIVPGLKPVVQGFKESLSELGYVENSNISYHEPVITKEHANLEQAVREIEKKGADLIFAVTSVTAKKVLALTDTPIIFAPTIDPIRSGLVKSFTHPGGTATGVHIGLVCGKALEWLQQIAPGMKQIFVPHHLKSHGAVYCLEDLQQGANKLGIKLLVKEIGTKSELASSLQNPPKRTDAIWLLNSPFLVSNVNLYVDSAIKHKLPLGSVASQYKSGVLLTYGHLHRHTGRKAGQLAHKVLTGQSPAELPVLTTDFFLGLNLKTAQAIGIEVPPNVLRQAADIVR